MGLYSNKKALDVPNGLDKVLKQVFLMTSQIVGQTASCSKGKLKVCS